MGENMLDFLRGELLQARLRKDTAWVTAISTAIGELERGVSNDYVSKEDMIAWAKSQLKAQARSADKAAEFGLEFTVDPVYTELLNNMLPKQLSDDDLYEFFSKRAETASGLGELMNALKSQYAGRYKGKAASDIAKSVLRELTK